MSDAEIFFMFSYEDIQLNTAKICYEVLFQRQLISYSWWYIVMFYIVSHNSYLEWYHTVYILILYFGIYVYNVNIGWIVKRETSSSNVEKRAIIMKVIEL